MEKRGPVKGSLQQGSLASKLANIRIGETIYINDEFFEGIATQMERQIQAVLGKSTALSGRAFSTSRWTAVKTSPPEARQILAITRNA